MHPVISRMSNEQQYKSFDLFHESRLMICNYLVRLLNHFVNLHFTYLIIHYSYYSSIHFLN